MDMRKSHTTLLQLSSQQIAILELLYTFRYGTVSTLQSALNVSNRISVNQSLHLLEKRSLVGRKYDTSYKLILRGAEYYLLPDSFTVLKQLSKGNVYTFRSYRRNNQMSDAYIKHCLSVFQIRNTFYNWYPNAVDIKTKFDRIPHNNATLQPAPDAIVGYKNNVYQPTTTVHFVELLDYSKITSYISSMITKYITYTFTSNFNQMNASIQVMCFCPHPFIMKVLQKHVRRMSYNLPEELQFYAVSLPQFFSPQNTEPLDENTRWELPTMNVIFHPL